MQSELLSFSRNIHMTFRRRKKFAFFIFSAEISYYSEENDGKKKNEAVQMSKASTGCECCQNFTLTLISHSKKIQALINVGLRFIFISKLFPIQKRSAEDL